MFSCDYNGWADVPEEEREAIDVYEASHRAPLAPAYVRFVIPRRPPVRRDAARQAA